MGSKTIDRVSPCRACRRRSVPWQELVCNTGHRVNPWPGARAEKRRLAGEVERGGYSAHAVCPYCGPRHIVPVGIPVNVIEGVAIIPAVRRVIPELVDWRTTPRCRSSLVNRTAVQYIADEGACA